MNLKLRVAKLTGRALLTTKKHAPELLVGTGVVTFVGTVVLGAKATLKVDTILEDHKDMIETVKHGREVFPEEEYNDKDLQQDMIITYAKTSTRLAKLYAPTITLGLVSVSCFLTAHHIMKGRNLALVAAYKTVESQFSKYRERVVDTYGEDIDRDFKNGIRHEKITVIDENGKKKKIMTETIDPNGLSEYAVIFNESSSPMWSRTPGGNMLFLKYQQEHANNILKSRGHVFLNEVYEWLGMPHTKAGAIVGWVLENGDDYIDFGTYELNSETDVYDSYKKEADVVLDFNVDGVVYDLI